VSETRTLKKWSTVASDAASARRAVAVATLFGAQVLHAFVMEDHFREWFAAGVFFLAIGVAEGIAGAGLMLYPSRRIARAAVWLSVATVSLWLVSRTIGLPFGPSFALEPVGRIDATSTLFEATTAVALLPLLGVWPDGEALRVRGSRNRMGQVAVIIVIVAALTVFATLVPSRAHG
jgi:hypothetical protein